MIREILALKEIQHVSNLLDSAYMSMTKNHTLTHLFMHLIVRDGMKGNKGMVGPTGDVGEVGEQGPMGDMGEIGENGTKGEMGVQGGHYLVGWVFASIL